MSNAEIPRHKVFISYHHANDEGRKIEFTQIMSGAIIDWSVRSGDIDPYLQTETIRRKIRDEYLRDSTVTVVLVGTETWKRKHVDWEINSSLRDTQYNPRSGLLGICLPSHKNFGSDKYDPHSIPPRLDDNIQCGFAKFINWTTNKEFIKGQIHEVFKLRERINPDLSRPLFERNREGERWYD
jgi:hypothetical protein